MIMAKDHEVKLQEQLATLHKKTLFLISCGQKSSPWAFFKLNANKLSTLESEEIFQCMFCHPFLLYLVMS